MTPKQARQILSVRRADGTDDHEGSVKKALAMADKDPELAREVETFQLLDAEIAASLYKIPVDSEAVSKASDRLASKFQGHRITVRNPALLAVGLGFLLLVAVLTWHFLGQTGVFPDEVIKIAQAGAGATPDRFEAVDSKAGELQDWFMLKGFDSFRVPPGFENFPVVGVRLFSVEGERIAQALVPEQTMFFYSFPTTELGIDVRPEKSWRVTEAGSLVLAVREERGVGFLIAFRGKKADMQRLLEQVASAKTL